MGIDDISITEASNPSGTGSANPSTVIIGNTTLLTVTVIPGASPTSTGLAVTGDLSSIGGSASQPFYDNGTNGDVTSGDNTFSFNATVDNSTPQGVKTIPISITDAQARNGSTSITLTATITPPALTISQVYGGGGNSGAPLDHDFIELYNPGSTEFLLDGWSVQYASSSGSSWQVTPLTGFIQPGGHFLVQENGGSNGVPLPEPDVIGGISMSGTNGKVALVNGTSSLSGTCPIPAAEVYDFVGYGSANCYEGSGAAPGLSNTTAATRLAGGATDTDVNADDFTAGSPDPHNSGKPTGMGVAIPSCVPAGGSTLLTVIVTPGYTPPSTGLTVTGDLTSIGGAASQTFYDDGSNGDVVPGDDTFSFQTTISGALSEGAYTIPITIADDQTRTASASVVVTVPASVVTPIHGIQGAGSLSPEDGNTVTTEGVVTAVKYNGFYLQTPDADIDADPNTSEGIFVFTSSTPSVALGDYLQVTGTVDDYIPSADPASPPLTEISGFATWCTFSTGNPLPAPITITAAQTDPSGGLDQLEPFEGMRVRFPSLTVVHGTEGSVNETDATSSSNGLFYAVVTGVGRTFREPGIEDLDFPVPGAPCCIPHFDENPERLRIDSDALVGAPTLDVTAGATLTDMTGVMDFAYRTWTVLPDPTSPTTITGNVTATPVRAALPSEFTVSSFNLERFFDTVNDPDTDDPVLTPTAFDHRLQKASLAIRNVLRTPDILGIVEIENLSTLQALASRISTDAIAASQPDPQYTAYLEEGNDIGGIDVGLLVKGGGRVTVLSVTQVGKTDTFTNPTTSSEDLIWDRPPLVLEALVNPPVGDPFPITVIVNHFRSLSGIDDPSGGERVRAKRNAGGEWLANYVQSRLTINPDERIVLVGDFNAYQFNDGYVDVMGAVQGSPAPADQVLQASADLIDPDLTNLVNLLPSTERYSFLFEGNAQVLDHVLLSPAALPFSAGMEYARNNADFPEIYRNDFTRPERISDHDAPVAYFRFPAAVTATKSVSGEFRGTGTVVYTVVLTNNGGGDQMDNPGNEFEDQLDVHLLHLVSAEADSGTAIADPSTNLVTWNGAIPSGTSVTITITATVDSRAVGGTVENEGILHFDQNGDGTNESVISSVPGSGGTGPTAFAVTNDIPAVSPLGLALLALILALGGMVAIKR